MKKIYMLFFIGALFLIKAQGQIITQSLQTELDNADPSDLLAITITMNDQYDIATISHLLENMTRQDRRLLVVSELKSFADISQQSLMNTITGLEALGQVENVRQIWCANMIACKAKPAAINQLAQRQDISMIHIDEIYDIGDIGTDSDQCWEQFEDPPIIPYHIDSLYVPAVWEMGYEGEDVVVAVLDTGVDDYHPDLIDNMWHIRWDFIDNDDDPADEDGHGTHVAGIIAGDGTMLCKTGVAPKAKIMAVRVFKHNMNNFHSTVMAGVEWSVEQGADILNISLGDFNTSNETLSQWRQCMDWVLEMGIVAVASAGNRGGANPQPPVPNNIETPGKIPPPWKHPVQNEAAEGGQSAVVCVGAVDEEGFLAGFSSVGQVTWISIDPYFDYDTIPGFPPEGGLIRPDVVAPGVDIISLKANFGSGVPYTCKSGTSMSAPAVTGVMALMLSKNPYLMPAELDSIIEMTAFHPDSCHITLPYPKDNEIGAGRVRADRAVAAVPDCDLLIYNNEVLSDTIFYCDIIVKPGGTLTINQNLWFARNRKIIIEPGGKLIVDGAKISRLNNKTWQGIEVWGNSTAHQFPVGHGNYLQGVLELNGAIIENAISAVELWKPDDYTKTGGIIFANDAVFRNNAKSVHALYYDNYNPINETSVNYNSYFRNCTFEITADYNGEVTFHKHVDLSNVKGFRFEGCDFLLDAAASNVSLYNKGIGAYNAGFRVVAYCTSSTVPCTSYERCTFDGFYDAVYASSSPSLPYTFIVSRAIFVNNTCGIRINSVNNFSILFSDFHIGQNTTDQDDCDGIGMAASGYGINANASTGFAIEENYFTKATGAQQGYYTGIRVAETSAVDEIYNNQFNGLSYGIYAEGKNWWQSQFSHGLSLLCNQFTGSYRDIVVEQDTTTDEGGIQSSQGSALQPAGNEFVANTGDYKIYNNGNYPILYYYDVNSNSANPNPSYEVGPISTGNTNNCRSHYGGGGSGDIETIVFSDEEKLAVEQEYLTSLGDYNNVKNLYDNLQDGGDTEGLKAEVESAWPADTWELRAELLDKSPHLSMEVLMAAADKTEVLPESILFEILVANPDELRNASLINYLEEKENPLPQYMINILRQVAYGATYKTALQNQMAENNRLKTRAANDMIRSILNQEETDYNALRNWLENRGGIMADRQIIETYLAEGNVDDALALAVTIPQQYQLSNYDMNEHAYYMEMLYLQIGLLQQGRNYDDLTNVEVTQLENLAQNSYGATGAQARSILEQSYGYHFCNCLNISDNQGFKNTAVNPALLNQALGVSCTADPNPAREWTAFDYTLPETAGKGTIRISDATGKLIKVVDVVGTQGQYVWDTREVKPGVYFFTFVVNGAGTTSKLVITK